MYIQAGGVKLSVLSRMGRETVVAMLGPGDFFGEGCLAGQPVRRPARRNAEPPYDASCNPNDSWSCGDSPMVVTATAFSWDMLDCLQSGQQQSRSSFTHAVERPPA